MFPQVTTMPDEIKVEMLEPTEGNLRVTAYPPELKPKDVLEQKLAVSIDLAKAHRGRPAAPPAGSDEEEPP